MVMKQRAIFVAHLVFLINFVCVKGICKQRGNFYGCIGELVDGYLEVKNPETITKLFVQKSELAEVQPNMFSKFSNLEWLLLEQNKISTIDPQAFEGLSKLKLLKLNKNKLKKVDFGIFKNDAYLDHNEIEELNQFGVNIRRMYLMSNQIKTIPKGIFNEQLVAIYLNENFIDTIDEDAFENTKELKIIGLSGNNLETISPRLFRNLNKLLMLRLEHNRLRITSGEIFSGLKALVQLDLSWNYVDTEADLFEEVKTLRVLSLDGMNLTAIPFKLILDVQFLITLSLADNQIAEIDYITLKDFNKLAYVSLRNNKLTHLDWVSFPSFKCFDVDGNRLDNVDIDVIKQSLPELVLLLCDKNNGNGIPAGLPGRSCIDNTVEKKPFRSCEEYFLRKTKM